MLSHDERLAIQERLKALIPRVAAQLTHIDGLVGVAVALKRTGGDVKTDNIVFRVIVKEKKPLSALAPDQVIPATIEGVGTDVVQDRPIASFSKKERPIIGGAKTTPKNDSLSYGTLGCVVTLNSDGSTQGLSNQHVWSGSVGSKVGQPDASSCHIIGSVTASQRSGTIDGAIAKLDVSAEAKIKDLGNVTGTAVAAVGDPVKKTGARTGLTDGVVTAVGITVTGKDDHVTLTDQMEIMKNAGADRFSNHGDSGSAIVNGSMQVVGLLWGGSDDSPYDSVASTIQNVQSVLGVTVATQTTSLQAVPPSPLLLIGDDPVTKEYIKILSATPNGQAVVQRVQSLAIQQGSQYNPVLVERAREIEQLVHHNRAVTVVWEENKGPAFGEALQNALQNPDTSLPKTVDGVTIQGLVDNMSSALIQYGSPGLAADVQAHRADALALADSLTTGRGGATAIAQGALNCAGLRTLWSLIWEPTSSFYLPMIFQNGLQIGNLKIPPLAQVGVGDLPETTLFKEPVLGYIRFQTTGCTLTGLPTITQGTFDCVDTQPGQTTVTLGLSFSQLQYSGNFIVKSGGLTGCALSTAAVLLGGGALAPGALAAGAVALADEDVAGQIELARAYRDGVLQESADGKPNPNGQLMVGAYYVNQDTVNEIISDAENVNVRATLTAPPAKTLSQQVTTATQAYQDDPGQTQPLPENGAPGFNVNNAIAAVCIAKILNHQDPDGRYQALLTDQTQFYQTVTWAQKNEPAKVKSVNGVIDLVQTTDPNVVGLDDGSARVNLVSPAERLRLAAGEGADAILPQRSMPVYDPVHGGLLAYVTLDGPAGHYGARTPRPARLGDLGDLNGTFTDTLTNVTMKATLGLAVDSSTKFQINVEELTGNVGSLDIVLSSSGGGWSTSLFDQVQNAIANTGFIKDTFILLLRTAIGQQAVRDQLSLALTGAINNI